MKVWRIRFDDVILGINSELVTVVAPDIIQAARNAVPVAKQYWKQSNINHILSIDLLTDTKN